MAAHQSGVDVAYSLGVRWFDDEDRPPAPWEGYEVWRHVPELVELPPAEAGGIYRKIRYRVWRCGGFWGGMIWPGGLVMVVYPSVGSGWNWGFWNWEPVLSFASAVRV